MRDCFDESGHLKSRPRRGGKVLSEQDAIGLAMLFAYVNKHPDAVEFLIKKDGNWNLIGVNNGTALHRAAWDGDLAMVKRLVAKGADIGNRENPPLAPARPAEDRAAARTRRPAGHSGCSYRHDRDHAQ